MWKILMIVMLVAVAPLVKADSSDQSTSPAAVPGLRTMRYTSRPASQALAWQIELRGKLSRLMKIDDLLNSGSTISFDAKVLDSRKVGNYTVQELEINSTPERRIRILLTLPNDRVGRIPAVVCISGHGSSLYSPYEQAVYKRDGATAQQDSIYRAFGSALASRGYAVISTCISWHEVHEADRSLMGERLWDVMRCVDYLQSMKEVDGARIGCAGLSLGGEMTMWLGAMDERVRAVVSAGFLTSMDQMESHLCLYGTPPSRHPCWKFPGLRELIDWPDLYSLIAPRPLECQNGLLEEKNMFYVPLARRMMEQVRLIYVDLERPENVRLDVHPGEHVMDLPSLLYFFDKYLPIR